MQFQFEILWSCTIICSVDISTVGPQISLDPIMKWKYRHFPSDFCSKWACFTFPNRRFTGDIAKEAHHVTAVDFMQSFTDKNREINGPKFANIDFMCADVTKLDLPKGR